VLLSSNHRRHIAIAHHRSEMPSIDHHNPAATAATPLPRHAVVDDQIWQGWKTECSSFLF
jgi:hypothetical protein